MGDSVTACCKSNNARVPFSVRWSSRPPPPHPTPSSPAAGTIPKSQPHPSHFCFHICNILVRRTESKKKKKKLHLPRNCKCKLTRAEWNLSERDCGSPVLRGRLFSTLPAGLMVPERTSCSQLGARGRLQGTGLDSCFASCSLL